MKIKKYLFDNNISALLKQNEKTDEWPVVYILNNKTDAYIGETISASRRMKQHWENPKRKKLKEVRIIIDDDFNKSATLDVESSLISLFSAENKFKLQNGCSGVTFHKYNNMSKFAIESDNFRSLWNKLRNEGLVKKDLIELKNSDLFKFSPYKSLNEDQCIARDFILGDLADSLEQNKNKTIFVNGSAGTGKTILALYLLMLLTDDNDYSYLNEEDISYDYIKDLIRIKKIAKEENRELKIGYVISMSDINKTIKKVAKGIKALRRVEILKPKDVVKAEDKYDVLLVDEAHRLRRPYNITNYRSHRDNNIKLGLDEKTGTELDWILLKSRNQILFYDLNQSIGSFDIKLNDFIALRKSDNENTSFYFLESQMRCKAGNDYLDYINDVLHCKVENKKSFDGYVKVYEDINELVNDLGEKEAEYKLCRLVSGFGWKWNKKGNHKNPEINIQGRKFYWNKAKSNFLIDVGNRNPMEEVGCIHTTQGFDINYCGVIFGPEIDYDETNNKMIINESNFYDVKVKNRGPEEKEGNDALHEDILREHIINTYSVLLSRGIHGTYIYAYNKNLRNYLSKYL